VLGAVARGPSVEVVLGRVLVPVGTPVVDAVDPVVGLTVAGVRVVVGCGSS